MTGNVQGSPPLCQVMTWGSEPLLVLHLAQPLHIFIQVKKLNNDWSGAKQGETWNIFDYFITIDKYIIIGMNGNDEQDKQ